MAKSNERLEIVVDETGDVTIEAFNFVGGACKVATKAIEDALGTVDSRKMKNDQFIGKATKNIKVGG